eukprot:4300664-Lingulodinium_polyedra.AAC.1
MAKQCIILSSGGGLCRRRWVWPRATCAWAAGPLSARTARPGSALSRTPSGSFQALQQAAGL